MFKSKRTLVIGLVFITGIILAGAYFRFTQSSIPIPVPVQSAAGKTYIMGLIGNTGEYLQVQRQAGVDAKLFSLSWRRLVPDEGAIDQAYFQETKQKLDDLYDAGFNVILNFGLHDTPSWIHDNYSDTYYVNQFGDRFDPEEPDQSSANFIFNKPLRSLAADYMATVFSLYGEDFIGVRVGGGRYGELTYPPAKYRDYENNYWAFDDLARAAMPVSGWIPGDESPDDEAERFLNWYLDALVDYQQWQIATVRELYSGDIMVLYPSWGIRPGDIEAAIETNLDGSSSAESNGEIQRGFDFARQISAITDPAVVVTTTWLDADATRDQTDNQRFWSPVKYLASLTSAHPLKLRLFGENTGRGDLNEMYLSVGQMQRYNLQGMLWFREEEMVSGEYATLDDYHDVIDMVRK